jgi:outer membrane protein assembly factor BamA
LRLGDLRQSVGAGLRYTFPFGPIRVEYAWILGRKEGEPKGRFVFGLGHAF